MTQVTLPNGQHHTRASNGVNGVVGKGKAAVVSAPPPDDVQDYYEIDVKPPYLDGYTFEDIVNFRPISDPYDGAILPPFARRIPIDVSSFRTGYLPTPQDFSSEIHQTFEGQIPFAEILDRVVQDAYGNLNELAEVMPSFSDLERKTRLIQYAVSTRKQIIKVYAISKWARVADDVQKAL
ncbi:mediator complex subunit, partial [Tulasnella sp. 403]